MQLKNLMYVKIDRKKGILVTTFLRALGYDNNEEILKLFYNIDEVQLSTKAGRKIIETSSIPVRLAENIVEPQTNEIILEVGQRVSRSRC